MRILVIFIMLFSVTAFAQEKKVVKIKKQVVEASCGTCKFGMEGNKCALAVKIDGKTYYVNGTKMRDHGDPHSEDGFCHTVRKAKVKGKIVDDKFESMYFKLLAVNKEDHEGHDHNHDH